MRVLEPVEAFIIEPGGAIRILLPSEIMVCIVLNVLLRSNEFIKLHERLADRVGGGLKVAIFNAGEAVLIGGTSASAPTFSSILTRVNEERLQAGKSTVGFVNPLLVRLQRLLWLALMPWIRD